MLAGNKYFKKVKWVWKELGGNEKVYMGDCLEKEPSRCYTGGTGGCKAGCSKHKNLGVAGLEFRRQPL